MTTTVRTNGGPAFPIAGVQSTASPNGMSLRDWFASHAPPMPDEMRMAALVASQEKGGGPDEWQPVFLYLVAKWNYRYANAMLDVRAKIEQAEGRQ